MDKLIITAAVCGAEVTKKHNPAVPYTIEELAREAEGAYKAGASIIHLHVREDDGTPTQSAKRFKAAIEAIMTKCPDVIIQPSTGGAVGMTADERLQPLALSPEMATLDCGTLNFGGDDIFVNTENMIIEFVSRMNKLKIKPECEVFDKSMIDTALRLSAKGHIPSPLHFNLVMGVNGGISGTPRDLLFMRGSLPPDATFTVSGVGKCQLDMAVMAIIMGGHVRVGFEDNVYLKKGILLKSNAEIVKKIARIAGEFNREIATPDEARSILKLAV
ncbi:MAG: 3-keto-5-aminohexanoate cleavage protein [Firmicutes bacterium]|nr:3-keto-5-aminohexanoate cleavage protein [Bacillota bacterium]